MQHRGTFRSACLLPKGRDKKPRGPRLMDLCEFVRRPGEDYYQAMPTEGGGEFQVVDLVTLEKACFEWPSGAGLAEVQSIIEGHFGVRAHHIGGFVWLV